ncbi:MAG: hypothetical protein ACM3ZE_12145, partial [Myxococcales bacterium]
MNRLPTFSTILLLIAPLVACGSAESSTTQSEVGDSTPSRTSGASSAHNGGAIAYTRGGASGATASSSARGNSSTVNGGTGNPGSSGSLSNGAGGKSSGGSGAAGGSVSRSAAGIPTSGTGNGGTGGAAAGGATGMAGLTAKPPAQAYYYVSPAGSDDNPGTEAAPFQTIPKARDVVRSVNTNMTGDIYVYLRGGTYPIGTTIGFGPQDSGTKGYRIYYHAYPGETPVLNGATKVTGWAQHSDKLYKAALNRTTKLRNLYVNDTRAFMPSKSVASKGGTGTYSVTSGQANWAWASGSGSDGIKYATADVPAIASNKDDLEIVNGTTWNENIVCTRDVVTTSDGFRGLMLQQPYG